MRLITWNMGCAYGSTYKTSQPRTWRQLLAWDPDFALVQETLRPDPSVAPGSFVFTPYAWSEEIGTLIYSKSGILEERELSPILGGMLRGQVTLAGTSLDGADLLLASIHAGTEHVDLDVDVLDDLDLDGVGGSHTTKVYPLDLILSELKPITSRRRFVVGGDLNASIRFDDLVTKGSALYGNVEWFSKARDAKWCNAHRKFYAGDERTLFRPGKPGEFFQIDHVFTDGTTWNQITRCDVMRVPFLTELTDHAPLVLEVDPGLQT